MTIRAQFITIEGQDGAGKSTNIAVIKEQLQQLNIDFVETREPGGTKFGESIRELMLGSNGHSFGDKAELLLMFAARAEHLERVVLPALATGKWVLCDRFTDATYAYQGGGRQLEVQTIAQLEQLVQGDFRPNLTILLDLPVEVGQSRTQQRAEVAVPADRFEQQKLDFKQRVRDAYLGIAQSQPDRVKVVDASLPLENVEAAILKVLQNFVEPILLEASRAGRNND
ncbi:MAG: dTMP kinase [Dinoroseobacter sp.]|jgi:dTMP kinase